MSASIDYKSPVVVVVGYWNAAILGQAGWVVQHLLNIPEGQQFDIEQIVVAGELDGQLQQKYINFFGDFGISCSDRRLELFSRGGNGFDGIYRVLVKIASVLPHTPVQGFGVNFNIRSDEIEGVIPRLSTDEGLEVFGNIIALDRQETVQMELPVPDGVKDVAALFCTMNLRRFTRFNSIDFGFNFHFDARSIQEIAVMAERKPIAAAFSRASEVLLNSYGIAELQDQGF